MCVSKWIGSELFSLCERSPRRVRRLSLAKRTNRILQGEKNNAGGGGESASRQETQESDLWPHPASQEEETFSGVVELPAGDLVLRASCESQGQIAGTLSSGATKDTQTKIKGGGVSKSERPMAIPGRTLWGP